MARSWELWLRRCEHQLNLRIYFQACCFHARPSHGRPAASASAFAFFFSFFETRPRSYSRSYASYFRFAFGAAAGRGRGASVGGATPSHVSTPAPKLWLRAAPQNCAQAWASQGEQAGRAWWRGGFFRGLGRRTWVGLARALTSV